MVAYANPGTQYNQYRQQGVLTASPGELTLMLYDGCIKNLKLAKIGIEEKDYYRANENSKKAQYILDELIRTLDMSYPIAAQMMQLYDFIIRLVIDSNIKKDIEKIDSAVSLITELRDTWQQAVRLNRQRTATTTQS